RLPLCALVLAVGAWAGGGLWQRWQADRERAQAQALVESSGPSPRALALLERSARRVDHPETARLAGLIEASLAGDQPVDAARLRAAAADFERAARRNPFRASTWSMLEIIYRRSGREDLARSARARGAAFCPSLRDHAAP
ncbi:MAG: hypothetical protein PHU21_05315, partial [Elusimicrobia bacterium]|nr:hypothetical protein [Elusimicrobiota bacterium]